MKPTEIIGSIQWAEDADPEIKREVEDAIAKLVHRNRPTHGAFWVYHKLEAYIQERGSVRKAAEDLEISKSFLHDMRHAQRPYTKELLPALGVERVEESFRDIS